MSGCPRAKRTRSCAPNAQWRASAARPAGEDMDAAAACVLLDQWLRERTRAAPQVRRCCHSASSTATAACSTSSRLEGCRASRCASSSSVRSAISGGPASLPRAATRSRASPLPTSSPNPQRVPASRSSSRRSAARRRGRQPRGAAVLARQGREHARYRVHAGGAARRCVRDPRCRGRRPGARRRSRRAARQRPLRGRRRTCRIRRRDCWMR